MTRERVDPGWAWARKLDIAVGIKAGDTIYLSGLVALDPDGKLVGEGDMHAQSAQVFRNIAEALAAAGATMSDVVKINTFLTDMSRYAEFARARTEAFRPSSARTCWWRSRRSPWSTADPRRRPATGPRGPSA